VLRPHEFRHVSWHLGSGPYLEIGARSQNSRRHAVPARQQGHHPDGAGIREEELASGASSGDHAHTEAACPGPAAPGPLSDGTWIVATSPALPMSMPHTRSRYSVLAAAVFTRRSPLPSPHAADDLHNWTICAPLPSRPALTSSRSIRRSRTGPRRCGLTFGSQRRVCGAKTGGSTAGLIPGYQPGVPPEG
jgi:hypothetical protein